MTMFKPSLLGIATLLTLGLNAIPAHATALRTFVSSTGNDANTASSCIATAPCRTLAAAFSVTQDKGHIFMTDVAGYGALTITRSVTLVAIDGALIGVPSGGTGITINAGVNDDVAIDGLILDGAGVGANGIVFNTGKSLTVTKSVIRGMTNNAIRFQTNASSALVVSNTLVTNNDSTGILVQPTGSGTVTINLNRVELHYMTSSAFYMYGGGSTGTLTAVVADSVATHSSYGFRVDSSVAASRLMVIRSVISSNNTGLYAYGAAATLRFGQSTVTGNGASWTAGNSALLRSYGDNNIDDNNDADPTPSVIGKK